MRSRDHITNLTRTQIDRIFEPFYEEFIEFMPEEEPEVCKEFGCAKHLTLPEKLMGNTCIKHQKEKK